MTKPKNFLKNKHEMPQKYCIKLIKTILSCTKQEHFNCTEQIFINLYRKYGKDKSLSVVLCLFFVCHKRIFTEFY